MEAKSADLDSKVFFEIPEEELDDTAYRHWVDYDLLPAWLGERNPEFMRNWRRPWNEDSGLFGEVAGRHLMCKFYKLDGTAYIERDRRGILIRDHYSENDVEKVHFISDDLERFLQQNGIGYRRENAVRLARRTSSF